MKSDDKYIHLGILLLRILKEGHAHTSFLPTSVGSSYGGLPNGKRFKSQPLADCQEGLQEVTED